MRVYFGDVKMINKKENDRAVVRLFVIMIVMGILALIQ